MWNDWDQITAAQNEVDKILEERRAQWAGKPPDAPGPPPEPEAPSVPAPREIVPSGDVATVLRASEPMWTDSGFGRHVLTEMRRPDGSTWRLSRWEKVDLPPLDPQRARYLLLKELRSQGDRGLQRLRQMLRGEDTE